jgi:hypothetical protein
MDLELFRRPPFAAAVLGAVAVFVALNMTLLLNSIYLQHARPSRSWHQPDLLLFAYLPIGIGLGLANAPRAGTGLAASGRPNTPAP